jgi:hypothetical protein
MLIALGILQDHVSGMPATRRARGMSALVFGPFIFWRIRLAVAMIFLDLSSTMFLDLSSKGGKVTSQNSGELGVLGHCRVGLYARGG